MTATKKQIVSARRIARVVSMAVPCEIRKTPEGKLWIAVIEKAMIDAETNRPKGIKDEAIRFLSSDGFRGILDMLDVNFDYVQEIMRDHAGWARA